MVNGYTDNPDPRWRANDLRKVYAYNPASQYLRKGQYVFLNYRDPNKFKNQQAVRIIRFRVVGEDVWADLDGQPSQAPQWALVAAN